MASASWLSSLLQARRRPTRTETRRTARPCLERLEDRVNPVVLGGTNVSVSFAVASETINAVAGTFSIKVLRTDAIGGTQRVPFTLGGTATAGTDYTGVSASPLIFPGDELGTPQFITGKLLPHPGGPNKTLTFTLARGPNLSIGIGVNTLTITEPALAAPARAAASALAAVSASAGGTGTFAAPVGNSAAPGQAAVTGSPTPTTAPRTVAAGPATPAGNVRATDDAFLAGSPARRGLNVAPPDLTGNDVLRLVDALDIPG